MIESAADTTANILVAAAAPRHLGCSSRVDVTTLPGAAATVVEHRKSAYTRKMRRGPWAASFTVIALVALVTMPASSAAAGPPSIESESVAHVTASQATLQARINPGGLETSYEFWLEFANCQNEPPGSAMCESISLQRVGVGTVPSSSSGESVSAALGHLQPSYSYTYWAVATNSSGEVVGEHRGFRAAAAASPSIEAESLSHLTSTDATLEAQIDTEGLEAAYEFRLSHVACSQHQSGCEMAPTPIPLPSGELLGSFLPQTVSIDLGSAGVRLGVGEWFYAVSATSAAGTSTGAWHEFEAPAPVARTETAPPVGAVTVPAAQAPPVASTPATHHRRHRRHGRRRHES